MNLRVSLSSATDERILLAREARRDDARRGTHQLQRRHAQPHAAAGVRSGDAAARAAGEEPVRLSLATGPAADRALASAARGISQLPRGGPAAPAKRDLRDQRRRAVATTAG